MSAFMIALLTQRALLIAPYPMPYELLYDQPFINWTTTRPTDPEMAPVRWPPAPLSCLQCANDSSTPPGVMVYGNCAVCVGDGGRTVSYMNWINKQQARNWHTTAEFGQVFPNVHTLYYSSNVGGLDGSYGKYGATVTMFHNIHHQRTLYEKFRLRPSTAFGCMYNYLFFPKPETLAVVQNQVWEVLAAELVIGVQIRTDDRYMRNNADMDPSAVEPYKKNFACAQSLERALGVSASPSLKVRWLLVADSGTVRHRALEWYGDKIITYTASKPTHVSSSGTEDILGSRLAAAEHWMFGMTDYQVIAWWSGYGRTASMRSLRESSVLAIRDEVNADACAPSTTEHAWALGTSYSGVRHRAAWL
ncbi:hypothetical protein PLESTM_001936600 [Pleodorina starrii]|nr:hypothetical protein PLESTM_001936600 [Pleodorina starrii]